jgi:cysteine desulfurase
MARHYLDHASTSPLRPEARDAMVAVLDGIGFEGLVPADPSRIHAEGMAARVAVEQAREQVAGWLGARPREVVFTSSATEAIAAATWGAVRDHDGAGHVVVSAVEHSAVREASAAAAAATGGSVTVVGADHSGRIDPVEVAGAIRADTALVHVQWGNHEVGTRQPVAEVVAECRARGVLVHIDAAQAAGHDTIAFDDLGADLLSVSGHKVGGPPGTGALLVRRGLRLTPLLVGGDQERARRAGLENVPALAGLGACAARLADPAQAEAEVAAALAHTRRVLDAVPDLDGVAIYGDPVDRLPHLVCLGVAGIEPQAVLLGLDQAGVAAHSGSACASEGLEDSPVLEAMGVDAHRSLRVSVGWSSTDADVDALLAALPTIIARLRSLGRPADD